MMLRAARSIVKSAARTGVSFHKKALVPREQAAQKLAYLILKQTALPLLL